MLNDLNKIKLGPWSVLNGAMKGQENKLLFFLCGHIIDMRSIQAAGSWVACMTI